MDGWLVTVVSLIGSTIITTFIGVIVKKAISKQFDKEKELAELRAEKERRENSQIVRNSIIESLAPVSNKVDNISQKLDTIARGTQAVLRDRLIQLYNYCNSNGYATLEQKQNFENMYSKYHNLGQNGVMDSCYEKIMAMSDKDPDNND